jgi:hypothetical protein
MLTPADLATLLAAASGWVAVYFQHRSVKVSESQLRTQVQSLTEIVDRIEQERREREATVATVRMEGGNTRWIADAAHRFLDKASSNQRLYVSDLAATVSSLSFLIEYGHASEQRMEWLRLTRELCRAIGMMIDQEHRLLNSEGGRDDAAVERALSEYKTSMRPIKESYNTARERLAEFIASKPD